jgi:HD-GYP domain-containing protein (c-di-GMP phosphodiesterase class II)
MMAIADVFDAVTAQDRPYRPAVPPREALDMLSAEADQGKLDGDLLDVFITHRVYEQSPSDTARSPAYASR